MLVCYPPDMTSVSSLKNIAECCLLENKSDSHITPVFLYRERPT